MKSPNLGNKVKALLLTLAFVIAFSLSLFVYIKARANVTNLRASIAALKTRLDELNEKSVQSEKFNQELKYISYEMDKVQTVIPPRLEQERFVMALRRIEKATGVKFINLKFSPIGKVENAPKPATPTDNQSGKAKGSKAEGSSEEIPDIDEPVPTPSPEPVDNSGFKNGDKLRMQIEIGFRGKYLDIKNMLREFPVEKYRMVIDRISIESKKQEILTGTMSVTAYALLDMTKTLALWESEVPYIERGADDLFLPLDGYGESDFVILPKVDPQLQSLNTADFYLKVSAYNDAKPAVLIGKYGSLDSEIYYDGNEEININFYMEEREGQVFFRARAGKLPYPDEENSVHFFPKRDVVEMDVIAEPILKQSDKVRVQFNIYNNTGRELAVNLDDISERVDIVVKQGKVVTAQK